MAEIAELLGDCDLRIGNWESPLWGDGGVNVHKVPRLCTTRDAASAALPLKLDVALLANNHAYDCLEKGFENTVSFLEENGIAWLGAGMSPEQAARPLLMEREGRKVGLLNYVAADTHPNVPCGAGVYLNLLEVDRALAEAAELRGQCDIVIANLHWGVDLSPLPHPEHRNFARRLIEAGADVVVGHHAHCLQADEQWGQGYIFYGLGNFVFEVIDPEHPWPALSRRSAVGTCVYADGRIVSGTLTHFIQDGLRVQPDQEPGRLRYQAKLNRTLLQDDGVYMRSWRRARLYHRLVFKPRRFLNDAGGVFKAMRRLRGRHFRALTGLVPGHLKC